MSTSTPTHQHAAHATVATTDASRYLLQLCKHFRGKLPVEFDRVNGTIALGEGVCELHAGDDALVIHISAPTQVEVQRLQMMAAKHLTKFDRHGALEISWT